MSALGDLPPLDAIILSDTQYEKSKTYQTIDFYSDWLTNRGMHVEITTGGNIRQQGALEHIHMPFWTANGGPLRRQCTREFKIIPGKRAARIIAGYHPTSSPHPPPGSIEQWIGFSYDEWHRQSSSRVKFIIHRYPLIERKITRSECVRYLIAHHLPVPVKSACIGCPYTLASEWLDLYHESPGDFRSALAFDEDIRCNPLAGCAGVEADHLFIYKHGPMPLLTADLEKDSARERQSKQLPLFICGAECGT